MNKDVSRVYHDLGLDFEARWFPVAYLLNGQSSMAVTEIADSLGYTHTAINSFAKEMTRKGLIEAVPDPRDGRRRMLRLTGKGRRTVAALEPVWREIWEVAGELVAASSPNLLASVENVERQLDEKEVYERIRDRFRPRMLADIEIVDYTGAYKRHFRALNIEWLTELFRIEESDEAVLADPKGRIIDRGGAVLFARLQNRIVGTAALIRHDQHVYELAKMAVARDARRRLVGTKLTEAIVDRARDAGARELFLETHKKLTAAQQLYEKTGFERVESSPLPVKFKRSRIVMWRKL